MTLVISRTNVDFFSSEGKVRAGLLDTLLHRDKAFIVMGAYGRDMISTLFKASRGESVLKVITQAVFIAHI
ncbi:hypothetical protein BW716_26225 [[Flexibacter] sp. ATCC 35208]|nr:hypothetical protein BW716_26225 [[Flexibacter] sp. ATCC 35208]